MNASHNDTSFPAAPRNRSRRNRRPRSPDAMAPASNPVASGSPRGHHSLPLAPRGGQGQGQGQGQGPQARAGSGLHQTINNHYHYTPYEGAYDSGNGSGANRGGVGEVIGSGSRGAGHFAGGGEGPAMDVRGAPEPEHWEHVYGPQGRGQNQSQGYDFPAANTNGCWPESGPRPRYLPPGHQMYYAQNGGGLELHMHFGWGRSAYGS